MAEMNSVLMLSRQLSLGSVCPANIFQYHNHQDQQTITGKWRLKMVPRHAMVVINSSESYRPTEKAQTGAGLSPIRSVHVTTGQGAEAEEHESLGSSVAIFEKFQASEGRVVECNSRGCKPVFEDEDEDEEESEVQGNGNWPRSENVMGILQSRIKAYHAKCDEEQVTDANSNFYKEFAEYVSIIWMQTTLAHKYYIKALEIQPSNLQLLTEYAEFVLKELKNPQKAEEIYEIALRECPEDVQVLGSYASFLWQTDE
eukprot:Gb_19723 [translate_table: standard]